MDEDLTGGINGLDTRTGRSLLQVCAEIRSDGHEPGSAVRRLPIEARLLDLTAGQPSQYAHLVRIKAPDLRDAQNQRSRIRKISAAARVLVDIEVMVAADAASARRRLALLDVNNATPSTIRYVGTPVGLAGLIADISAAQVADGVTLLPLVMPDVMEEVIVVSLPWLEGRGLIESAVTSETVPSSTVVQRNTR